MLLLCVYIINIYIYIVVRVCIVMASYARRVDTTKPEDIYNKAKSLNIAWNDALIRGINELAVKKDAPTQEKQSKAIEFLQGRILNLQYVLDEKKKTIGRGKNRNLQESIRAI